MDKNAIKKYAVWARKELIEKVSQKALKYGIEDGKKLDSSLDSVNGILLSRSEKMQRQALITRVKSEGYSQVIEEVAYTWFNRFIALRFMEVNGYLPSHVRVFSDENGKFVPKILAEALHVEIPGLDVDYVMKLKTDSNDEELFSYLLIAQCNALYEVLPYLFSKIEDYTELLLPDYLLRDGSVIERLVNDIPEDNFDINSDNGQIEIVGWMYQYYISEKHEEVVDPLYGKTIEKKDLPAATQLFTTDWVVRYIVDNSLGKYWIERNKKTNIAKELDYYVPHTNELSVNYEEKINPRDITVFDPCVGSGHFLIYAFDLLMKMYVEYGFSEREAALEILNNNLFGIDIDERAVQLACFSIVMKARQYDRRLFTKDFTVHIRAMKESELISEDTVRYFINGDEMLESEINKLMTSMSNAKEYGSIIKLPQINWDLIENRVSEIKTEISLFKDSIMQELVPLFEVAELLDNKYTIVVTNPPYFNKYDKTFKKFLQTNFKDYLGDLFSVFVYRNFDFCVENGYTGFMTPFTWMFIQSYEKLRNYIIENKRISTLVQMEYSAYEEATVPICTFVLENKNNAEENGQYFRLSAFKGGMEVQKRKVLEAISNRNCGYYMEINQQWFKKIPGMPIAYWVKESFFDSFENDSIGDLVVSKAGIVTGSDPYFVRMWQEVNYSDITFKPEHKSLPKYVIMQKGGPYRQYYGNNIFVVKIRDMYDETKVNVSVRRGDIEYYYKEGIGWSLIGSNSGKSFRLIENAVCGTASPTLYPINSADKYYLLGLLNSPVGGMVLDISNPTLNLLVTDACKVPVIHDAEVFEKVSKLAKENVDLQKEDWDNYEQSWDFKCNPLLKIAKTFDDKDCKIEDIFKLWEDRCKENFEKVKKNQEEINASLIDLYELGYELSKEVDDKSVSMNFADKEKDIKDLISFSVGCMFGRYSIENEGIIYAGGDWGACNSLLYQPDEDNIIPINDDEYFQDDIVERFIRFIEVGFGTRYLDENLRFIVEALGENGNVRDALRSYFINSFYVDHCSNYSFAGSGKRPIYWLFDSGKKNGFKCLIYMHRYQPDTLARIRTDYVHEQQARYRIAIEEIESRIDSVSGSERVKLSNRLKALKAQDDEIHKYEERIHHLADQMISIDLDDGVKHNYEIFKDVLAKIK